MKTFKLIGILAITMAFLLSSCGVEKRRYRKGYNVDKTKKNEKSDVKDTDITTKVEPAKTGPVVTPVVTPPINNTTASAPSKKTEPTPAYTGTKPLNTEYDFKVVVGPRPDKKGKKKYPMNMR